MVTGRRRLESSPPWDEPTRFRILVSFNGQPVGRSPLAALTASDQHADSKPALANLTAQLILIPIRCIAGSQGNQDVLTWEDELGPAGLGH